MAQERKKERKINLLFCSSDNNLASGAFLSLVSLCKIMKNNYNINPIVILPISGDGQRLLENEGIKYYKIPQVSMILKINASFFDYLNYIFKSIKKSGALFKIINIIKKEDIDIIHLNSLYTHLGAIAGLITKKPFVWHIRETIYKDFNCKILFKKQFFNLVNKSNRIIAISEAVNNEFPELTKDKVSIIYDGIEENTYKIYPHHLFKNTKTHFLCVGHIFPNKGQMELLKACKLLLNNGYTDWNLRLLGKGDTKPLEKYIVQNKLSPFVEIIGFSPDVKSYLAQSDIAFIPSHFEAFGRTCVEALFAGCLVIAANAGALPEIITDNKTGLLFESKNEKNLYEKIIFALTNKPYCAELAKQGQKEAIRRFTVETNAANIHKVYTDVLTE